MGNSIGNSIKRNPGFPDTPFKDISIILQLLKKKKRANAILTGRFIGKTYTEYQREFVEHFPYGKQIGNFLDQQNCRKRPQAQKPILLGQKSEKADNHVPNFEFLQKYLKFAHEFSVQNGSYAFPNELVRFRI